MLIISVCGLALADDFTITPLEKDLDLSVIHKNIKLRSAREQLRSVYLSPGERDKILSRFIPQKLPKLDQFDRDLLYKSLLNYDEETLKSKYDYLKTVNVSELKHAFN